MKRASWIVVLLIGLSGCSAASLPYKPESPPSGPAISADYTLLADRLRVEIQTGGYRLEDAQIVKDDGGTIRPQTIEHPMAGGSGSSVGLGVGTGSSTSVGSRSAVGVGTGIGVSFPVGGGSQRVSGNTVLYFPLNQIGAAPWRLFVKVAETSPAVIMLPPR